jgi:hypothetical protein
MKAKTKMKMAMAEDRENFAAVKVFMGFVKFFKPIISFFLENREQRIENS